ncbi:MAG: hypothetical protein IH806_05720 [Proteobacteria bacterium]|nr:hypothetical protein [Pseudomonadota bacterium]
MSRKPFFPSQRFPRRPVAAVAAAVIVLAAACEPVQPPKVIDDSATEAADAEVPAAPTEQKREAEAPTPETPAPAPKSLPDLAMSPDVRGRDIVPGPDRVPAPRTLLGLENHQVMALLGEPSFTRRDDPAQIWQYRDSTCILDVFLYRPVGGGAYRVTHVEVRGHGVIKVSDEDCFLRLLKPRNDAG